MAWKDVQTGKAQAPSFDWSVGWGDRRHFEALLSGTIDVGEFFDEKSVEGGRKIMTREGENDGPSRS
jgi:hypothetical protein